MNNLIHIPNLWCLPSESILSAALDYDPTLIEMSVQEKVILATPTILITLLKAIAYGWRQENLAENAKKIVSLHQELVKRIGEVSDHFKRLGKNLTYANEASHGAIRAYETRVLSSLKKFESIDISFKEIDMPLSEE